MNVQPSVVTTTFKWVLSYCRGLTYTRGAFFFVFCFSQEHAKKKKMIFSRPRFVRSQEPEKMYRCDTSQINCGPRELAFRGGLQYVLADTKF